MWRFRLLLLLKKTSNRANALLVHLFTCVRMHTDEKKEGMKEQTYRAGGHEWGLFLLSFF